MLALAHQELDELISCDRIEVMRSVQQGCEGGYAVGLLEQFVERRKRRRNPLREVMAAVAAFGAPEWRRAGRRQRGFNQDVVVGDALNSPVAGAQRKNLPHLRFPHELFIEFANLCLCVELPKGVVAAIGNAAATAVQRQHAIAQRLHCLCTAIERNTRRQTAYTAARKSSGQHVDDQIELDLAQVFVSCGTAQNSEHCIERPGMVRTHR